MDEAGGFQAKGVPGRTVLKAVLAGWLKLDQARLRAVPGECCTQACLGRMPGAGAGAAWSGRRPGRTQIKRLAGTSDLRECSSTFLLI